MDELVFEIKRTDDGGYAARALGCAIFTEADALDELEANVHDAVRCHFNHRIGPRTVRLQFVRPDGDAT